MLRWQWIFTIPILLCQNLVFAQHQETFSHLSVNDGLSQSTVYAITQDSKGFLWFGTREGGLNTYDGYDFHVYKNSPELPGSLSDNAVFSILEDSNEVLWIGTRDRGINRFDPATGQFKQYPLDMKSEFPQDRTMGVGSIYEDRSGRIWLGTKFRVYLYNKEADRFDPGLTQAPFPVRGITGICEDKQGFLYFATWDRLIRYHPDKESLEQLLYQADPFAVFGGRINPLLIDQQDRLWLGTPEGLKTLHTEGEFRFIQNEFSTINWPASFSYVRTIKEARDGVIWFGTGDGLYSLSPDKTDLRVYKTDPRNPSSLIHNSVYSIFEDRVGTLWIGTWSGISKLDKRKYEFEHYFHSHNDLTSLSSNIVSSFEEGRHGTWIGTEQGGLNFMNEDRTEFIAYKHREGDPSSLLSNNVKSIFRDSNQDLWIGTFNGGLSLYNGNGKFTQFLEGHSIYTLAEMPGRNLYVGSKSGLFVMDLNTREVTNQVFPSTTGRSSLEDFIMTLFVDSKNRLWIGTRHNGVYLFDDTRASIKQFQSSQMDSTSLSGNYVISICEDQNHNIWIGTSSGLNLFEEASFSFVRNHGKVGLENYVINGMMPDDMGRLWISTNSGILNYSPLEGDLLHFEHQDGLQSNEFNRGAYYKNSRGEMFFGGVAGFNVFRPEDISRNPDAPPVIITDLKLFNKSIVPGEKNSPLTKHISDTREIVLTHRQSSFSLDFVALNYLIPEKNRYAYKLEGYDTEFIQSGKIRSTAYMNLKPGKYTFRVIASNNDGVWNQTGTSLDIHIKGPLWASPLAIIFYIIILTGLLVLLVRIVRYRTEKESELSFERAEKARLLELSKMRLQFFTNISHEFRTPLTLITSPLNKLMSGNYEHQKEYLFGMMKSNVNRMLRLVNQLMDFRKLENEKMPLRIRRGNLNEFVSQIVFGFDDLAHTKMIELKFKTYEQPPGNEEQWYDEGIIDKVTYNLLSNAFKFTPEQGIIEVSLFLSAQEAKLVVSDTGKGIAMDKVNRIFERFYSESSELHAGTGIGLSLSKKLIDLHKGDIQVESEIGKGATFEVTIPISKEAFAADEILSDLAINDVVRPELDADYATPSVGMSGSKRVKSGKTMLIAEDQNDLALYLSEHFADFDTAIAENGKIAYDKARELIPDVIISDIMMPEMDGLEFCKLVKEDMRTSHIPVVLLSARTAIEQKLDGLETGADAYVEKPFDAAYLSAVVKNLLDQRRKLRQKFSGQLQDDLDKEGLKAVEKDFFDKVDAIIKAHISDPEFSVEELMSELSMSRSQLYRKFKAISSRNPSEYIRLLRLSHASTLLKEQTYTINEVAFMSGFGNVSYFNTCFKKHFGISPGKYVS